VLTLQVPDYVREKIDMGGIGEIDPDFHVLGGRTAIMSFA
jgi:hypothetical protein